MQPNASNVEPEWIWVLQAASRRLALGSMFLLAASVLYPGSYFVYIAAGFIAFTVVAVLLHLFGWLALGEGASRTPAMRAAYVAALGGLAAGVLYFTLWIFPGPPLAVALAGWLILPYMPVVYGPVVIGHAALFLLASQRLGKGGAPYLILIGSGALLAIAVAGLYLQASTPADMLLPSWGYALAGLTSVGYGLATIGLGRERERRRAPLKTPRAGAAATEQTRADSV